MQKLEKETTMSLAAKFPWPPQDRDHDPELGQMVLDEQQMLHEPMLLEKTLHERSDPKAELVPQPDMVRQRQTEGLESVGRMAGAVAHDFNNLLTGVLLYCDLLLAQEPGERVRKYAEEIRNAGTQAAGLVQQLLAVARPSKADPRLLSLNEIVENTRDLLARLIGENIDLQFRLDPTLGCVKMDPTQARQVLLNLALNARDAMPAGGEIIITTQNCQIQVLTDPACAGRFPSLPCALFVVEDNGTGMDAATRSRLFEVFFTTKPAGKGTGLGLAMVHDIVTAHGGLIHLDSAPGCGTRVSILLPAVLLPAVSLPLVPQIVPQIVPPIVSQVVPQTNLDFQRLNEVEPTPKPGNTKE
jgi:signal transduction histidine kinase